MKRTLLSLILVAVLCAITLPGCFEASKKVDWNDGDNRGSLTVTGDSTNSGTGVSMQVFDSNGVKRLDYSQESYDETRKGKEIPDVNVEVDEQGIKGQIKGGGSAD